jgi:hypothetical protein
MNPNQASNEQELYTLRALADQAQDPNSDVNQIMHHLQANMQAMTQLQQEFGSLQSMVQEQAQQTQSVPAPITTLHTAVEALATNYLEQQQMHQSFQASVQHVLERLSQRSGSSSRLPIPVPLATKFKGDNDELSFSDFKAKLQTAFARFPESLHSDKDKIQYALQSMEGIPFKYFAPYVNGDVTDDEGTLDSYNKFMSVLEEIHGDQHNLDEVETKLQRLRQSGTMTSYIASFRTLSARLKWNEAALVARFKDGLSDEVKTSMASYWNTLKTLRDTQTKATTVYNNLATQQRYRFRGHGPRSAPQAQRRSQVNQNSHTSQTPASNDMAMDLDALRIKRLSSEEKQRRRDENLCLYCGGAGHRVRDCEAKRSLQVASVAFQEDQGNESA